MKQKNLLIFAFISFIFFHFAFSAVAAPIPQSPSGTQAGDVLPSDQGSSSGGGTAATQQIQKDVQQAITNFADTSAETQEPITVTLQDGREVTLKGKIKVEKGKITADFLKTEDTEANDAEGFQTTQGGFNLNSAKILTQGRNKIINGKGIKYNNGVLTAEHADSYIRDNSVTTNLDKIESTDQFFSVDSADSFLSDCIRVDNIKDSEFKVSNKIEITTKSDVNLKITDCSFNEVEFSGKGKVTIDKNQNPTYNVENGTLTKKENGYNESIQSNNSVIIETDKTFGFKCITINPVGSYFYNDKDLRKDFIINVPKESSIYKLCLRKNQAQQFKDYNGLVDFVNKKIELNGIVNYLKYPLKNNQIASLLSNFVYKGLKDINTILSYDTNLIFLNNIFLTNKNNIKTGMLSMTYPSNYYTIKEMEVNGEIHSVVELNLNLKKEDLTENINYDYGTDYFGVNVRIISNTLFQEKGDHSLTIYPPGHKIISEILGYGK